MQVSQGLGVIEPGISGIDVDEVETRIQWSAARASWGRRACWPPSVGRFAQHPARGRRPQAADRPGSEAGSKWSRVRVPRTRRGVLSSTSQRTAASGNLDCRIVRRLTPFGSDEQRPASEPEPRRRCSTAQRWQPAHPAVALSRSGLTKPRGALEAAVLCSARHRPRPVRPRAASQQRRAAGGIRRGSSWVLRPSRDGRNA